MTETATAATSGSPAAGGTGAGTGASSSKPIHTVSTPTSVGPTSVGPTNAAPTKPPLATARQSSVGQRLLIRSLIGLVLLTGLVGTSAWLLYATSDPGNAFASDPDAAERHSLVAAVRTWSFESGMTDPVGGRSGLGDLVVIDPNAIRHDRLSGERKAVTALQNKPNGGRRLVIGYLSLTEAEQRRPYWQSEWVATGADKRPTWLQDENPQRRGNWRVDITDSGWHAALYGTEDSLVDRMLSNGFDGVYLDTGTFIENAKDDRSDAEWRVAELISRIATYARLQHPRFIIMLDDAEQLIDRTPVASAIDIGAKHDLLFGRFASGRPNRPADIEATVKELGRVKAAKRPVFVVEHLTDAAQSEAARQRLAQLGFVATVSAAADKDTVNVALPH
jgi:cysteinyl-tRNA synthetase, unknown class